MSKTPPKVDPAIVTLEAARALLAQPNGWTQNTCARNAEGIGTYPTDERATSFCMVGALYRVLGTRDAPEYAPAHTALRATLGANIPSFNDHFRTTQEDVLEVFDKTLARLRAT